jgi:hypothetical protein
MYGLNVYEWPYYMCIQGLLLTLNGLLSMVTLNVHFGIFKFCVRYLLNILWSYYKFIQVILL